MTDVDLAAQLSRVRLESDTLYDVIGAIASSPDLDRVLDGVVDVLTKATHCHACFVYLRRDGRLRLRAASRVYAHLVGQVEFGDDEGLAGWVVRRNEPAFIRENALEDPRTNFVAELEEERFQSMVAVPIPSRAGSVMGVIVLHTIAPREFDERTLNLLAHAAPLVAGAIENAQLYEDARRRVEALTALSALSQRIAGVEDRAQLYRAASEGVRALLGCDGARLYERDAEHGQLQLVAADPPGTAGRTHAVELRASVAAGEEQLGELVAEHAGALPTEAAELLRAVANQVAVALKKAELIERLTEESIVRDLFGALEQGHLEDAAGRAQRAHCDLDSAHVYACVVRAPESDRGEALPAARVEGGLRRLVPGALCDAGGERVRALLPLAAGGSAGELAALDAALARLGEADGVAVGRSDVHRGATEGRGGLREASDAAFVTAALRRRGGALAYRELGAYRYLVPLAGEEAPPDPYLEAVRTLDAYDRRRGSQLVATLEQYLADRRRVTETARALTVHPNTLRQRLERIETLTGLDLASADLLALELAVKLARLRPSG
jgi:GAF domain-containing protein